MNEQPILHMICGKIAAGKSTLVAKLSARPRTIVISEDEWLAGLYGAEMSSVADYVKRSEALRAVMAPHLVGLLRQGLSVALDFPANTPATRQWMRSIFEGAGASHELHYLDVTDDVCRARLRARNLEGKHQFSPSEEQFDLITSFFVAPSPTEAFNMRIYGS